MKLVPTIPWRDGTMPECPRLSPVQTTGSDLETIREWREQFAAEQTITNAQAVDIDEAEIDFS